MDGPESVLSTVSPAVLITAFSCQSKEELLSGEVWRDKGQSVWYQSIDGAIRNLLVNFQGSLEDLGALRQIFKESQPTDEQRRNLYFEALHRIKCDKKVGSLTSSTHTGYIIASCLSKLDPELAFSPLTGSLFHKAISNGAESVVRRMLSLLSTELRGRHTNDENYQEELHKRLDARWTDTRKETALVVAIDKGYIGIAEALLDQDVKLADCDAVLQKVMEKAVETPFDKKAFDMLLKYKPEVNNPLTLNRAVEVNAHEIARQLLLLAATSASEENLVPYDTVKLVIEKGDTEMWKVFSERRRVQLQKGQETLLHIATRHGQVAVVSYILAHCPELATVKDARDNFALSYLEDVPETYRQQIRDDLVANIIRSETPYQIRKVLELSEVEAREICLHLCTFDTRAHSFAAYAEHLTRQPNGVSGSVDFEKVLSYANFPELSYRSSEPMDDYKTDRNEVTNILKWLADSKKVKEIMKITVLDHLYNPHDDVDITEHVNKLKVRSLNWRKLDLFLGGLDPEGPVEKLHLYSSGNAATIQHWFSDSGQGGLMDLKNLKQLHVHVVEDVMSDARAKTIMQRLDNELLSIKTKLEAQGRHPELSVRRRRWAPTRIERQPRELNEIGDVVVPKLAQFIQKYKDLLEWREEPVGAGTSRLGNGVRTPVNPSRRARATQVAVIDTGIVIVDNKRPGDTGRASRTGGSIRDRISGGHSFVHNGDDESSWWHALDPHGTQMASLICAIDPRCKIHVAKVGDSKQSGVTPEAVMAAIKWAVSRDVDIISMSLALYKECPGLEEWVKKASDKDILIFCSTADKGNNLQDTWPAKYGKHIQTVMAIAACDEYGKPLDWTQETGYNYRIHGKDILAGAVPFLTSHDYVTGSSAATAIAAGLGSLILSCHHLAGNTKAKANPAVPWRKSAVANRFDKMKKDDNASYVIPSNLCVPQEIPENFNVERLICECFGDRAEEALKHWKPS